MIEIDENEVVIKVIRRHWIVLFFNALTIFFLTAIPVSMIFGLHFIPLNRVINFSGNSFYAGAFLFFAWILFVWLIAWTMWTIYYLDTLIITNKRLFNIDQYGLFRRESFSFRADRIQNVSVRVNGVIQTLLDYGTIRIETAGEREDFIATYIPHPYEIKRLIGELQDSSMDKTQTVRLDPNEPREKATENIK